MAKEVYLVKWANGEAYENFDWGIYRVCPTEESALRVKSEVEKELADDIKRMRNLEQEDKWQEAYSIEVKWSRVVNAFHLEDVTFDIQTVEFVE